MIAYLDLPSGLSGDMFLGCLVDCGWSIDELRATVRRLNLPADEWSIDVQDVHKSSIRATLVDLRAAEGHHHRHLSDIRKIIEAADLPSAVQQRAIAIFTRLADAEAKVHGTTRDKIHFHEVGAVDAIIDIVGAVAGVHALGITKIYASPVPLGAGWAKMAHGQIPLPAPATLEILAAVNAPTGPAPGPGELLTPTGAAILAELATFGQPAMSLSRIGMGAGRRDLPWPNIARMWLGELQSSGAFVQLDTNIDDMNPQLYPAVTEQLFAAGAKDVWFTPVSMKKGRPGVVLSALGSAADEAKLTDVILRETTTLGVRVHPIQHRHEARRELRDVATPFGTIRTKIKWLGEEAVAATPEFEDCRAAAERCNASVKSVVDAANAASQALLLSMKTSANS
jgi:uncharacterized protein (TIGR00299 family) protein